MPDNIIEVFRRGNEEMFHSAFLAWLMDESELHGFGDRFFRAIVSSASVPLPDDYFERRDVSTESRDGNFRFDILVRPTNNPSNHKGVVFENKVKCQGDHAQVRSYKERGYKVIALAFVPEMLDQETRDNFPMVDYRTIKLILETLPLKGNNFYHFLIKEYLSYLTDSLSVYDLLKQFALHQINDETFLRRLSDNPRVGTLRDNDIRTYNYFYYQLFEDFLKKGRTELVFGNVGPKEAENQKINSSWYYEKNYQGPPFMEAVLRKPHSHNRHFQLHEVIKDVYEQKAKTSTGSTLWIIPRIEIWLDLGRIIKEGIASVKIGRIMLGTHSQSLKDIYKEVEPYRSTFNRLGSRNDHFEPLCLRDLPLATLAERIKQMMLLIGNFR